MNVPPWEDPPPPVPVASSSAEKKRKRGDDDDELDDDEDPCSSRENDCREPMPPPTPDPLQYIALREEGRRLRIDGGGGAGPGTNAKGGGHGAQNRSASARASASTSGGGVHKSSRGSSSKSNKANNSDAHEVVAVDLSDEEHDNLRMLEKELALAWYNCHIREKIQDCHRRAKDHQRAVEEQQRRAKEYRREATKLECDLNNLMVLPRLNVSGEDSFWLHMSPELKHSKEMAWALLRADSDLPLPFQRMLWRDPACPLRSDREILIASIRKGLDCHRVRIVWCQDLVDDRELVLECFEKCPGCLTSRNDSGLLKPYLRDMEALRAFTFAPNPSYYRTSGYAERAGIDRHFSPALFKDPEFMADLIVQLFRRKGDDGWACLRLKKALPQVEWAQGTSAEERAPTSKASATSLGGTLLDNAAFAIRVADGLAFLPPEDRLACLLTYATLTDRVRGNPKVALAFAKVDPRVASSVPDSLRNDAEVWDELWTVATDHDPFAIYSEFLRATPCNKLLASKELVPRLLEKLLKDGDPMSRVHEFAKFFPSFSSTIQHDREINMQLVVYWALLSSAELSEAELPALVAPEWIQCRDFWTDLAKFEVCPCAAWKLVPEGLANDKGLLILWARRAYPLMAIDWLAAAVATFPNLGLLSDRQVLLNWLPQLCSDHPTAAALLGQVPQECLERSLWLKLFQTVGPPRNFLGYIPENLRSDPDIVDAQLRWSSKDDVVLAECFGALSSQLRRRFLPRIVRAMQCSSKASFDHTWLRVSRKYKLYRFQEAALAILSRGESIEDIAKHDFHGLGWRSNPEFLLTVADVTGKVRGSKRFWQCCSDTLRRDKAFLLRVLKGTNVPKLALDEDLKSDFDIKCALHLRCSVGEIREAFDVDGGGESGEGGRRARERERGEGVQFARQVRARLQPYVSLHTFMAGVRSNGATSGPVALLGQDEDTVIDFKRRLVEYLGCPSRDEAMDLRRLSNKLTLAGY